MILINIEGLSAGNEELLADLCQKRVIYCVHKEHADQKIIIAKKYGMRRIVEILQEKHGCIVLQIMVFWYYRQQ